jgi:hypothetical protein
MILVAVADLKKHQQNGSACLYFTYTSQAFCGFKFSSKQKLAAINATERASREDSRSALAQKS